MDKHKGMVRGYYHLSRSWYGTANLVNYSDDTVDSIMIGFYGENGNEGTTGEFEIKWSRLGKHITPRLMVFDDSWETLTHFSDLLQRMSAVDGQDIPPTQFCEILNSLNIKDLTPVKRA